MPRPHCCSRRAGKYVVCECVYSSLAIRTCLNNHDIGSWNQNGVVLITHCRHSQFWVTYVGYSFGSSKPIYIDRICYLLVLYFNYYSILKIVVCFPLHFTTMLVTLLSCPAFPLELRARESLYRFDRYSITVWNSYFQNLFNPSSRHRI